MEINLNSEIFVPISLLHMLGSKGKWLLIVSGYLGTLFWMMIFISNYAWL